jgi:hypothetical protein
MRGIYVMRFLLFSGGLGIALAMVERGLAHSDRPIAGFLAGTLAGMVVFRGQLRAARGPALLLSRRAVYFVQRRRAVIVPWQAIQGAPVEHGLVMLRLRETMAGPDGGPTEAIALNARRLGAATSELASALDALAKEEASRERLPPDEQVQALLGAAAARR